MTEFRFYIPQTGWIVVVKRAPLNLGWLCRVESGPLYRGPAVYLGLMWWWRPTYDLAHKRALREALGAPKR